MEGRLRCTLGSQAQHAHSVEGHTRSIQQSTSTHTKHIHNIQQQNSNCTQTHCELFHQTIHKHCQTRNTQSSVISPTLFNIYTSALPPPNALLHVMAYVDDITISSTHTQARVQPRNTYSHTYIRFLSGQNKTISY